MQRVIQVHWPRCLILKMPSWCGLWVTNLSKSSGAGSIDSHLIQNAVTIMPSLESGRRKTLPLVSRPSENSFKDFLYGGYFTPWGFYGSFEALEPLLPRLPDEQQLRNALCLGVSKTEKRSIRVTSGRVGWNCLCHESWMALKKRIPWMALEGLQGWIASIGPEQVFRYWAYMAWTPMFYQVGEATRYPD